MYQGRQLTLSYWQTMTLSESNNSVGSSSLTSSLEFRGSWQTDNNNNTVHRERHRQRTLTHLPHTASGHCTPSHSVNSPHTGSENFTHYHSVTFPHTSGEIFSRYHSFTFPRTWSEIFTRYNSVTFPHTSGEILNRYHSATSPTPGV